MTTPQLVTPVILTYNEAPNIGRTLERLRWASDIVVIDSFSTDETIGITESFPQTRVVRRSFDAHSTQWNYGLDQCHTDWVLALDADYILSDELIEEIADFAPEPGVAAYFARFNYYVHGRPLRAALYPPRPVVFRRHQCRYEQDGHTQFLRINGTTGYLNGRIHHDDWKPLARWIEAQSRYADLEVEKLLGRNRGTTHFPDKLRLALWPAAPAALLYTLFWKACILDGRHGLYYALQRTYSELLLSLKLLERKISQKGSPPAMSRETANRTA